MSESADALVGRVLGSYRVEKVLGEGAMGEVVLAVHEALGRPVAIKMLKPHVAADRALTERFFAEARAVNIIRHENIVECTDLVNDPQRGSYIVMELLEGHTLSVAIREAGRIPPRRAARIAAQIADAIGAAHGKGIVHRDLKPDNVFLIRRAGSSDYVKVLDFGIARLKPELGGVGATQSGALIGTPAYMSPEQARGEKVGPAADIYAVGVITFHMLTGQLPFAATSMTLMLMAHLQETPPRVDELARDVPAAVADVIARALAKDPDARQPDMAAFRRELLSAAGLPTEVGSSLVDSSPRIDVRGMAAASASGAAFDPLAATAAGTDPGGTALGAAAGIAPGASALAATMASDASGLAKGIGSSSISGAVGELASVRKRSRPPWLWVAVGGSALAIAAIVGVVTLTGSDDKPEPTTTAAAGAPPAGEPTTAPGSGSNPAVTAAVEAPPPVPALADAGVAVTPATDEDELAAATAELASVRAKYTESHPDVVRLRKHVRALELKLKRARAAQAGDVTRPRQRGAVTTDATKRDATKADATKATATKGDATKGDAAKADATKPDASTTTTDPAPKRDRSKTLVPPPSSP